jgi:hypothetical protein
MRIFLPTSAALETDGPSHRASEILDGLKAKARERGLWEFLADRI